MTTDKSSEREPTTRVKTFDDKTLVVEAATGAVIKNYHPRLTSMAVAFHEGIEYARAALPQQAQDPRCNEVFEALGLDPDRYTTEGGAMNIPKLRATIKHPSEYLPPDHWMNSPR